VARPINRLREHTAEETKEPSMTSDKIAQAVLDIERFANERWNNGDCTGYLDAYADDITYFDPATPTPMGAASFRTAPDPTRRRRSDIEGWSHESR
jgi:hypothetical protein